MKTLKRPENWIAALAIFLWLRLIQAPYVVDYVSKGTRIEGSWRYCNAYFLSHHFRVGTDFIFPTTLLGYFYSSTYDAGLFWQCWAWQLTLNGLLAFNLYRMCLLYPDRRRQAGLLLACALLLPQFPDVSYTVLLITGSSMLLFADEAQPGQKTLNILNTLALILISQVKITFLMQALVIVIAAAYRHWKQKRPWAASPLLLYMIGSLVVWVGLYQPLSGLGESLRNLLSITGGYNNAMGLEASPFRVALGFAGLCLLLSALFPVARSFGRRGLWGGALLTFLLLQMWKQGFVRNDGHAMTFYCLLMALCPLLPVYFGAHRSLTRSQVVGLVVCALLSLTGFAQVNHSQANRALLADLIRNPAPGMALALTPWRLDAQLQAKYSQSASDWDLPNIRQRVQRQPVDVFGNEPFAALLNNLNYRPRPVFQSYACYTPYLQALNSAYYSGAQAPAFVLFTLATIDDHMPAMEDGATLLELLRHYHPVMAEKGFLLLARNSPDSTELDLREPSGSPIGSRQTIMAGQEVPLPDEANWHLLSLRIKPTWREILRGVVLRPTPVTLVLNMKNGSSRRYRIIPEVSQDAFLLDPLVENEQDMLALYGRSQDKRIRSFHVEVMGQPGQWKQAQVEAIITPRSPPATPLTATIKF